MKKILAIILSVVMIFSVITTVSISNYSASAQATENVEILTGGEWVQGFWTNGAISTSETNHKKRSAYSVLLKVNPNSAYTFKTKTDGRFANSINIKEHNANKEQILNTNFQAATLGQSFTAVLTTTSQTRYLGITFWNSYENQHADAYERLSALLENGGASLSIIGPAPTDGGEEPETPSQSTQAPEITTVTTATTTTTPPTPDTNDEFETFDVAVAENWRIGTYDWQTGLYDETNTARACLKKLVKVNPAKTYIIDAKGASGLKYAIREYDSSKNMINSISTFEFGSKYLASSASVVYIGITMYDGSPLNKILNGTIRPSMKIEGEGVVSTDDGASLKLSENNGIRFYTSIDVDEIEKINTNNLPVEYGTIIAPVDVVEGEFTHQDQNVDVKYTARQLWSGNKFVASIVNIKEKNLSRDFVARGYAKIGDKYYYSATTCVRNLAGIADACITDTAYFETLNSDVKELVESWAKAND